MIERIKAAIQAFRSPPSEAVTVEESVAQALSCPKCGDPGESLTTQNISAKRWCPRCQKFYRPE